jgi:hypothetical protein
MILCFSAFPFALMHVLSETMMSHVSVFSCEIRPSSVDILDRSEPRTFHRIGPLALQIIQLDAL